MKWISSNQTLFITTVFVLMSGVGLYLHGRKSLNMEAWDIRQHDPFLGSKDAKRDSSLSGLYRSKVPVEITRFNNGDTCSVSHYDSLGRRTLFIERYGNQNTRWVWKTTYYDTTRIDEVTTYNFVGTTNSRIRKVNEEFDGKQFLYYENGNLKLERDYIMGMETGTTKYYNEKGKLLKEDVKEEAKQ